MARLGVMEVRVRGSKGKKSVGAGPWKKRKILKIRVQGRCGVEWQMKCSVSMEVVTKKEKPGQ